jgi:hypothetical protein
VHDVVPPVHVEDSEQRIVLELLAGHEARVGEEADEAYEQQRAAEDHAVPLRWGALVSVNGTRHGGPPII